MLKFILKKQTTIILTIFVLTAILPFISSAAETPALCAVETSAKENACKVDSTTDNTKTEAQKLTDRQACDTATLALDQCNLKTIREEEDVKIAAQECQSNFTASTNGGGGGGWGGQYVPVYEVGELLTLAKSTNALTKEIDAYTGKSYDMDIKLCMYLAAIKRVQYAMEDLIFIQEPDMQRQAATKVATYREGILGPNGLIQTGGTAPGEITEPATDGQPGSDTQKGDPLFVTNLSNHLSGSREEAAGKIYDTLKQSNNIFKTEVSGNLQFDEAVKGQVAFESTITMDDYNNFVLGGEATKNMSSDQWWNTFINIFDSERPNNPYNAYLLTQNKLTVAENRAEDLALREYQAGGGFLPTSNCVAYTSDGKYCINKQIETPGQIIARTAGEALSTKLQQYLDPALGKIGLDNEPLPNEAETFTPTIGTGGGSFWGTKVFPQNETKSGLPPTLSLAVDNIITTEGISNRRIKWVTANVTKCAADNDWFGTTNQPNQLVSILRSRLSQLQANDFIIFPLPLNFIVNWSKDGVNYSQDGMTLTTNTAKTSTKYTWTVPTSIKNTDTYYLKIVDGDNTSGTIIKIGGETVKINPATPKHLVEMFHNYHLINTNTDLYKRYTIIEDSASANPNINIELTEPIYKITCTGSNGDRISTEAP